MSSLHIAVRLDDLLKGIDTINDWFELARLDQFFEKEQVFNLIAAVRVGRVNGKFIANPTHTEKVDSDLDLVYVGNEKDVVMFEGSAKEITESDFNAALAWAQAARR